MQDSYTYFFSSWEELFSSPVGVALAGVGLIIALFFLAAVLVLYIFQSCSLYSIAKRRGISNPGLAWVPVAFVWILGSVSDQYQYVVRGKVCNRRKILLALGLACFLLSGGGFGIFVQLWRRSGCVSGKRHISPAGAGDARQAAPWRDWQTAALAVFQYISLYDVFQSCNPGTSVVFLVLSVIFPILVPFFLFADRKKRAGDAQAAGRSCLGAGAACGGRSAYRPPALCRPGSPGRFLKAGAVE